MRNWSTHAAVGGGDSSGVERDRSDNTLPVVTAVLSGLYAPTYGTWTPKNGISWKLTVNLYRKVTVMKGNYRLLSATATGFQFDHRRANLYISEREAIRFSPGPYPIIPAPVNAARLRTPLRRRTPRRGSGIGRAPRRI